MGQTINIMPLASGLRGEARVPGDKSISHRAVILGGLAQGVSHIEGLLEGEDVKATMGVMRQLGASFEKTSEGAWRITGIGEKNLCEPSDVLDMGNSGTSARLLTGVLAVQDFVSFMTGDASLRKRPMKRVMEPLGLMGVDFVSHSHDRLPMAVIGKKDARPIHHEITVPSAQVKSCLILAALFLDGRSVFIEPVLTRDHTENMVRYFGGALSCQMLEDGRKEIQVDGGHVLQARNLVVPADPSSAAFPVVAALIVPGSSITVPHVGLNPLRAEIFKVLEEMGADITLEDGVEEFGEKSGDLRVKSSSLRGVHVDAKRAPALIDEYPILSVAAAQAEGVSRFCGLGELRVKESDRLSAIVAMLKNNGVRVAVEGDDLLIWGTNGQIKGGGEVIVNHDHRLAMSASILGLVAKEGVVIDDTSCIKTSFPGYDALMNHLGAGFSFT